MLLQGPEAIGYETPLWTCPRVADLIEREFGVRYHEGHVWKVLVGLGWSPQRPTGKARERNEEGIRTWKKRTWPAIKRSPRGKSYHCFRRREWTESTSPSLPHWGAARADPGPGVQL